MPIRRRRAAAIIAAPAVAALTVAALTGCSAFPGALSSATPSASASATPDAGPIGAAFGDVAPRESVTDESGTYLHVTLAPESAVATEVDPATVGASIEGSSWDEASLLEAQRFVATFVAEQTIDSSALDRDEAGWQEWLDTTSQRYFGDESDDLLKLEGADRPTPIYNDPDNYTPRLVRDGLARLDDATIVVESLENMPREGGEWLTVTGTAEVAYRLGDEEAIASLVEQGFDEESVAGFEALADGEDGHYLTHLEWSYSVERVGDGWIIRGYELVWDSIIEGVSQA
jgi:hypothetical protein